MHTIGRATRTVGAMTTAERKAVAFFAALAAAGAGARALGIGDPPGARAPAAADRVALQRQLEAVDSAHARRERGRSGKAAGEGKRGRRSRGGAPDAAAAPPPTVVAPSRAARARRASPAEPAEPLVVDVNAADTLALQALPGVGPALARRIVADRAARGGYASMAELSRVRGIGAGLERRLAGAVTFTPGGRPSAGSAAPGAGVSGAGRYGAAPRVPAARWPAP